MREIGCYTGRVDDIVERELVNQGRRLEEEREGLANTARCTCDDCVVVELVSIVEYQSGLTVGQSI